MNDFLLFYPVYTSQLAIINGLMIVSAVRLMAGHENRREGAKEFDLAIIFLPQSHSPTNPTAPFLFPVRNTGKWFFCFMASVGRDLVHGA